MNEDSKYPSGSAQFQRIWPIALLLLIFSGTMSVAQTLLSPVGSSGTLPGGSVSWSVGETIIGTGNVTGAIVTQGFEQPNTVNIQLNIAAILEGPYDDSNGLMNDNLRGMPDFPLSEPFTALGYGHTDGGGESINTSVLTTTGNDAIVDWILLELRDPLDETIILASRSALVQRDGDVVDTDGISPVTFNHSPADYYVAVLHRNHLGIMTATPVTMTDGTNNLDFTTASTPTYGTSARKSIGSVEVLWAGDVSFDGQLKYIGSGNDRDPILLAIGGSVPTATTTGYRQEDVNMDGTVKYIGSVNDRDPILVNVGGSVPTAIRNEQLP